MTTENAASTDKLKQDVKNLVADADEALRAIAGQTGEKFTELRERLQVHARNARENLAEYKDVVVDKTRVAARATDDYVHEKPWQAVGIAACVGLVIGMLIGRR